MRNKIVLAVALLSSVTAQAGVLDPPANLRTIPSMGAALRAEGYSVVSSLCNNLSSANQNTPNAIINLSVNGTTSLWQEVSPVSVPRLRLVFANYYGTAQPSGELPGHNDVYVHAALQNPATNETFLASFGGQRVGRVSAKKLLISDEVSFPVVAGVPYNERVYGGVTGASNFLPTVILSIGGANGENVNALEGGTNEDAAEGGTISPQAGVQGYAPVMVLGYTGTSPAKSVFSAGDSIHAGTGEGGGQRRGCGGVPMRVANGVSVLNEQYPTSVTPAYGFYNGARGADTLANFVTAGQYQQRLQIASFFTTVISDMGTNDLGVSSLSTMQANKIKEAILFAGQGSTFVTTTLFPRTSSTNNFLDVASQTKTGGSVESTRVAFNDWLRDPSSSGFAQQAAAQSVTNGSPIPVTMFEVYDAAALVEVNSSNVLTLDGGYWKAPAGTFVYAGTITATGNTSNFTDANISPSTANFYRGYTLVMKTGTNAGQNQVIAVQVASSHLIINTGLTTAGSIGDQYQLWGCPNSPLTIDGIHGTSCTYTIVANGFPTGLIH